MYLTDPERKFLFNKFERQNFTLFFIFATALAIGTFAICNYLAEKSCATLIQGWYKAEEIEIQQGNLYSVLSKAQRTLLGSGLISAVKVFKIQDGRIGTSIFSIGNEKVEKFDFGDLEKVSLSSKAIGIFKYQISLIPEANGKYIFIFIGEPVFIRLISLIGVLSFLGAILFLYRTVTLQTKRRIESITIAARGVSVGELPESFIENESPYLVGILSELMDGIKKQKNFEIEHAALQSNLQLAMQVSHDIRSPLSVLNIIKQDITFGDVERKQLFADAIERINEVANDLLHKNKNSPSEKICTWKKRREGVELASVVNSIVAEKRITFSKAKIQINFNSRFSNLKAQIMPAEFKRAISNLLNNAVEALPKVNGLVSVEMIQVGQKMQISITDNGKGIPAAVMSEIGRLGFSHGKNVSENSGSGLGLYHAREIIESFGGRLLIFSKEQQGTIIIVELLIAE